MTMLDVALDYARRGWAVQPMHWPVTNSAGEVIGCSCGPHCDKPGKHPLLEHGIREASTDTNLITIWWRKWPQANIQITTGQISGLLVLDVDPRNGGDKSLSAILAKHGRPEPTPVSVTGGGGRHILWRHPGGPIRTVQGLAPGLDLLSEGSGVVAPPSLHASGRRYAWHKDGRLDAVELEDAPPWLFDKLVAHTGGRARTKSKALAACKGQRLSVDRIPPLDEGCRNDELMRIACRLRREQRTQSEAVRFIQEINRTRCQPPLPSREVDRITNGVYRRYAR